MSAQSEQGMTSIIGNLLLVAVVVFLGITISVFSLLFLEGVGTPTADATFEYTQTPAGLRMTPVALGTDATVRLNGQDVATFAADSAGQSVLLPTAPGDRITVVSRDGDQSVLVTKEIDERSEIGDFIAHYDFEEGSGSTLVDRSGNGNDGAITGATWGRDGSGGYLKFDGNNDDVEVTDIDAPEGLNTDVEAFTIAISYRPEQATTQKELIEHVSGSGANKKNWFITTRWRARRPGGDDQLKPPSAGPDEYKAQFKTGPGGGCSGCINGGIYRANEKHVIVGTYDGKNSNVYVDGTHMDSGTTSIQDVSMGRMTIGQDAEGDAQHYKGKIYEIRLYYRVFDEQEVQALTNAMP